MSSVSKRSEYMKKCAIDWLSSGVSAADVGADKYTRFPGGFHAGLHVGAQPAEQCRHCNQSGSFTHPSKTVLVIVSVVASGHYA